MPNETHQGSSRAGVDDPTFTLAAAPRGWCVHITWSEGEEGPDIVFASRDEAQTWIVRDAHDWLVRLAALAPPSD